MKKSKEDHKNTHFYNKFIFDKKLGMLFENRRSKVFGHFHDQEIDNKQILKYPSLFKGISVGHRSDPKCLNVAL